MNMLCEQEKTNMMNEWNGHRVHNDFWFILTSELFHCKPTVLKMTKCE